jgi:hypothetical protein
MMIEILILRLFHVVGGILWAGSAIFNGALLLPALSGAGPAAGPVVAGLRKRGLFVFLPTVAVLTILSGIRLMWITSAGFSAAYFATPRGATYAGAGAAAVVAFVLGMALSRPTGQKMGMLMEQITRTTDQAARTSLTEELATLQRRNATTNTLVVGLIALSAVGMAVARYLG